jgi:hypothetical protein
MLLPSQPRRRAAASRPAPFALDADLPICACTCSRRLTGSDPAASGLAAGDVDRGRSASTCWAGRASGPAREGGRICRCTLKRLARSPGCSGHLSAPTMVTDDRRARGQRRAAAAEPLQL